MRYLAKTAVVAAALLLTIKALPSLAQTSGPGGTKGAWTQFTAQHGANWRATWDPILGAPSYLRGGRYSGLSGDPEQVARSFLTENKALFHIESDLSDLSLENLKHSPAGSHVFLKQTYQGLPVFNGGFDIHISPANEVFLVNNRYAGNQVLMPLSLAPKLSSGEAAGIAETDARTYRFSDKTGAPLTLGNAATAGSPEIGIWRAGNDGYSLAYRIPVGSMLYVIDAHSGKILARTQLVKFLDGMGKVFDPNPVVSLNNANLGDQGGKNYKALNAAYLTKTLPEITQMMVGKKKIFKLVGPFVTMEDIPQAARNVGLPPPNLKKPVSFFTRNKPGFGHTMVYFHIDRNERYIQSLGFFDINNRSVRADAHATTDDNSFYSPMPSGSGFLAFGDGGVSDSEDADVILHEYGHAIQDNENPSTFSGGGAVEETDAMGEGFGDYWAISNNHSNSACFAAWDHNIVDFPAEAGCLRRADTMKHYPEAVANPPEEHADGEIWSSSLYDLFLLLGKAGMDNLILESHFFLPAGATFRDGAIALIDADNALNAGANLQTICKVMGHRGVMSPQDLADNLCEMTAPDTVLGSFGVSDIFTATCHGTYIAANVIGDFGADIQLTIQGTQNLTGSVIANSTTGTFKKLEVMRDPMKVGTPADLGVTLTVTASAPVSTATPPFNQCPAVGADPSCQALIVVDANGNLSIDYDLSLGAYDQIEDALIGVQNNSASPVASIPLASTIDPFAFDGDGICGIDPNSGLPFNPAPGGCPFGPTGYEGAGVTFSNIDASGSTGVVNFSPPIPASGSAYFSLEGLAQPPNPPLNYVVEVVCDGTNLALSQTADDQ